MEKYRDVAPLLLRLSVGATFFMHGWQKLMVWGVPEVTKFLTVLGFPAPTVFAYLLIAGELIAGAALILGICTHFAAKTTAIIALIALVLVHLKNGFYASNGGYEFILLILVVSISLLITGAGKYSIDAKWFRKDDGMMNQA